MLSLHHLPGPQRPMGTSGILSRPRDRTPLPGGVEVTLSARSQREGRAGALTVFGSRPLELPSFHWMVGFLLAGDSGCSWAVVGEGLAGWDVAFFPDGSSLDSDEGLLIPAMPPTAMTQAGSGSESIWGHPWSRSPVGARGCWEGQLPLSRGAGGVAESNWAHIPSGGLASPTALPSGSESPDLGSGKWNFSVSPQSRKIKEGLVLCPE